MAETEADLRSGIVALLPRLRRFAFGLCGTAHDADDLVQSAIERALKNEGQWKADTRLDSWMYKIVQNLWIDKRRRQRTRGEAAPLEDAMGQVGYDARETVEIRDAAARALKALAALSPEIRSAASLVIVNGHSYREAADALDVPIGTIMSRVARARGALEAALSSGGE
jgi:RNA polymerase sigma-70 factor (ECF subfamily)